MASIDRFSIPNINIEKYTTVLGRNLTSTVYYLYINGVLDAVYYDRKDITDRLHMLIDCEVR